MVSQTNTNDRKRGRGRDRRGRNDEEKNPYIEKVVSVRRVSKVVKGGRNLSFAAFVVIGDEKGKLVFLLEKLQLFLMQLEKLSQLQKKN